ncbi:metacaspase-2 [Morus notabilis]|uniref:metacaspase-2 n=1 Tax=Morus notabilis TaxID=981085 RepID=UPI000CED7614|nr:metacaspase-2 [Morus notabilis]
MEARRKMVHSNYERDGGSNKSEIGSKGICEGPSDLSDILRGLASKLRHRDRGLAASSYVSMNTKLSPPGWPSNKRPNKRALLCGVSYNNKRKYRLRGTVNDVKDMRDLLINKFGYPAHCIRVLTEFEAKEFHPTKKNIENSMKWLVEDCQPGDSLVFYFSGHGLRQPDFKDDEIDGFDETICPVDFMQEGMIVDNDINTAIVKPLKPGVKLHALVDSCHSGTILDLHHVYDQKIKQWKDNSPPSGASKSTSGGLAICLSACEDHQLAADTTVFTGKTMYGALTFIFIEVIKQNSNLTYGQLLEDLSETFDENASRVKCLNSRTLARLFGYRITQKPLLSSSEKFDVYLTKVSL